MPAETCRTHRLYRCITCWPDPPAPPASDMKAMTLRIPREQREDLEMVATVDGQPMSEAIREALLAHVQKRRADPEFQARLRGVMERNAKALAALHGSCDTGAPLRLVQSRNGGEVLLYECPSCLAQMVRTREQAEADATSANCRNMKA